MKKMPAAEARQHLPQILDEAEKGKSVELTRNGKSVAVVVPIDFYKRLTKASPSFWSAVQDFQRELAVSNIVIERELLEDLRDHSEGREIDL
jgi:prevent-host-death family protein